MKTRTIFRQWLPLATTWLMMSAEGPFLAAVIARLTDPKENLAAYGVAFSFALIIEAPIIMMMSAATALVKDALSYSRLRNFAYTLNGIITVVMLLFLIPPVFRFITVSLIGLPAHVADITHLTTLMLLPWPAAIGFRRFYQGILISRRLTRYVAYGTVIRISTMGATALVLRQMTSLPGAAVGGLSLSTAVVLEAVVSRFMTARSIREVQSLHQVVDAGSVSYPAIARFYIPLALTSLLALGVQPMITFFIGQSRLALESLAVLPVINSLVFVFRSFGLSFQEVSIANIGDDRSGLPALRRFALILGLSASAGLSIIAFTPLVSWWFGSVSGLAPELASFAVLPLCLQVLIPATSVLIAFQHSVLVHARTTTAITWGTAVEVLGILLVLSLATLAFDAAGAVAAALALLAGRLAANAFLVKPYMMAVARK